MSDPTLSDNDFKNEMSRVWTNPNEGTQEQDSPDTYPSPM